MKFKILALLLLIVTISSYSQTYHTQYQMLRQNEGFLGGGFGVTWIDNKPFYTLRFFPELAFANFGVGLDLRLEFDAEGNLRTGSFNKFEDYLNTRQSMSNMIRGFRPGRFQDDELNED